MGPQAVEEATKESIEQVALCGRVSVTSDCSAGPGSFYTGHDIISGILYSRDPERGGVWTAPRDHVSRVRLLGA
jgi:hypothetical protein